ncbi:DNA internalization-related competence protein ComEC/Rec2 [Phytohalomonas tamaricis]|uniref:DNA internalization-related competence protein ComEC/Rec2 n=1 Tax=Phytohalomonas tamaricis TaxID=2081032 RepID=UPI000D0B05E8|nr:DNA internalization-related competence protein ComEC/Rec2 [Phytohalomonas tamaricis]
MSVIARVGILPLLALSALTGAWLSAHVQSSWLTLWAMICLLALAGRQWLFLCCLLTLAWCSGSSMIAQDSRLADGLAGQDVTLSGRIEALSVQAQSTRLSVRVEQCQPGENDLRPCHRLGRVRLNWHQAPPLNVGERWQLVARLKPPHGYANPHAFDYAAWLTHEGYGATGYVRLAEQSRLLSSPEGWRVAARAYLARHVDNENTRRWLSALTLGEGEALSRDEWDLLADTGTTHLMVISGLHVGLVAFAALFLSRLMARLAFPRRWRAMDWPWLVAGIAALLYAGLAGFGPAAVRAAIMVSVALWVASGRHAPGVWQGWWLALLLIMVLTPNAIHRSGLWLSFGAVAVLILAWRWRPPPSKSVALLRTQWLLTLATGAAVLLIFGRLVPLSFVINLVAVPWVTFVLVPLGLLGWVLAGWPLLAEACWQLFGWALEGMLYGLDLLAGHMPAWQLPAWQVLPFACVLGLWAVLALLPGLSFRWRCLAALSLVPVLFWAAPPKVEPGVFDVTVHDVGQGELVVVETTHYRLMFDTGPKLRSGFTPLSTLWAARQHFDTVVVSHADNDHSGGVAALQSLHDVGQWRAPTQTTIAASDVKPCRAGEAWRVDGVTFRFLWPLSPRMLPEGENDRSCVLLIENSHARVLITGDAGIDIEKRLFEFLDEPVDLLVAGHHGSNTSSSRAFVIRAKPRHVIFSAGYLSAYHHPHDEVVRRFSRQGSCLWNTAIDGAVRFHFNAGVISVDAMRSQAGVEGGCVGVESAF